MSLVKIYIDGQDVMAPEGENLLEVARTLGIEIPSLCHDPRLEPFGACRQCLVEIDGYRGPVQSCGVKVTEGMVVHTATDKINSLRRLGLELLLSEHCGDCIAPCQIGCPAGIDIQGFIAHVANGEFKEAVKLVREKLPLPASVGRVCPKFCEAECRRNLLEDPVSICTLKRFVGDITLALGEELIPPVKASTGKKVAVVGGGPAGLTVAYYLALEGHGVTIFDGSPALGGMMRYGIPEYRLPKALLDQEINLITSLCDNVFYNKSLGRDFTLSQLKQAGFDAIFLGLGSWANQSLGLPGEELKGIYSGIGFLRKVILNEKITMGKRVVIIGGGNTAMDAARTSIRMGAQEVTVVYRRSRDEMPANPHEITQAEEEGVKFELLTAPVAFVGAGDAVTAIKCVKMQLGLPDKSGRRRPVPIEDSEIILPVDMVITATGQKLELASVSGSNEIILNRWGDMDVHQETMQGATPWLFAGGDCVTGPATVVEAIGAGYRAANSINQYLLDQPVVPMERPFNCSRGKLEDLDPGEFAQQKRLLRTEMPTLLPEERKTNFQEFELGYQPEMAKNEAERCLSCGCLDTFSCRLRDYATKLKIDPNKLGFGQKIHPVLTDHEFIIRDPNKCVLCGNCVRICQEVHGLGILGFVNRGSETVVLPALKHPLAETLCNSCGQCVAVCPTGALATGSPLAKPGPWRSNKVDSVCPYCNIGCKINLHIVGEKITQVNSPLHNNPINHGSLCPKAAYDQSIFGDLDRLKVPLIKKAGKLTKDNWPNALAKAGQILNEIKEREGQDSIAVILSTGLTNEEIYLACELGTKTLDTSLIYGEKPITFGESSLKGFSADFTVLQESDLIIVFNGAVLSNYPIISQKIKKRVSQGGELMIVSPHASELDSMAKMTFKVGKKKSNQFIKALISAQNGITTDLTAALPLKAAKLTQFIKLYQVAKKPIIVVDQSEISPDELSSLVDFLKAAGKVTKQLLLLAPFGNIQGQKLMGLKTEYSEHQALEASMKAGKIKGLLIIKDDLPGDINENLRYPGIPTILITPALTSNVKVDVVLPGTIYTEKDGSLINCEGRIQYLKAGVKPPSGKNIWEILLELAKSTGVPLSYKKLEDIYREVLSKILS